MTRLALFHLRNAAALAALLFSVVSLSGCLGQTRQKVGDSVRGINETHCRGEQHVQNGVNRRPDESIQRVVYGHAAQIFAIYSRALKSNPELKGRVVFCLEIQPSGQVASAKVAFSELNDSELESRLLQAIHSLHFGALDVVTWKDTYRMDFFPQ